jgi:hypothetical protein
MKATRIFRTPKLSLLTVALVSAGFLSACSQENAEDRQLSAGLTCLDTANTAADADTCMAKVAGNTSQQAYMIRCSANMVAQGFTGARIANAFQKLKENPGAAGTQSTAMMSYFVFKPIVNHTADDAVTNCKLSGSNGLYSLANTAKFATFAVNVMSGSTTIPANLDPASPTFDYTAIKTTLSSLYTANNATNNAAIGTIAQNMQASACGAGSALSTQDICTRLNNAITSGGTDPAMIGRAILYNLTQ